MLKKSNLLFTSIKLKTHEKYQLKSIKNKQIKDKRTLKSKFLNSEEEEICCIFLSINLSLIQAVSADFSNLIFPP